MKRTILVCFIFSVIIACHKDEYNIVNLNGNRITALGHAGMGIGNTYPMNSYESIFKCLNLGMDGTEFDVQMTKDSVLVAYHSQDLSDETNLKQIDVKKVVQKTFDCIVDALVRQEKIELRNFGVFKVKQRKSRTGRNPRTNQVIPVPPRKVVVFKAGLEMKQRVR